MQRIKMAVTTILTVALMMTWAVPAIAADLKKVNINAAPKEDLMTLNGIGEVLAAKIVAFRKKNGGFKKPEDIILVNGIGQKIYEKNKDLILVQ